MIGNNHEEVKTIVQLLFNEYQTLVLDIRITSKVITRNVHR